MQCNAIVGLVLLRKRQQLLRIRTIHQVNKTPKKNSISILSEFSFFSIFKLFLSVLSQFLIFNFVLIFLYFQFTSNFPPIFRFLQFINFCPLCPNFWYSIFYNFLNPSILSQLWFVSILSQFSIFNVVPFQFFPNFQFYPKFQIFNFIPNFKFSILFNSHFMLQILSSACPILLHEVSL